MKRLLALLTLTLIADIATADIPPPPPPKGKKYVSVSNEVILGKDVSGYVFVQQKIHILSRNTTSTKLELTPGKATAILAGDRRIFASLVAVPEEAAKEFKTDDDLFKAVSTNKIKGAARLEFPNTATVSDTVKENTVKWTYTITGVDAKGFQTKIEGEGYEPPAKKDTPKKDTKDSPDDDDTDAPAATAPRGGMLIAGVAAFAALMFGGLWLAGRARRKA